MNIDYGLDMLVIEQEDRLQTLSEIFVDKTLIVGDILGNLELKLLNMEIIEKIIKVKYKKDFKFDVIFDLKIYDRNLYQDIPNLTEETYWYHAVNLNDVKILLNNIKVNNILSDDVRDKIYIKIRKEINKFIDSKLNK